VPCRSASFEVWGVEKLYGRPTVGYICPTVDPRSMIDEEKPKIAGRIGSVEMEVR